MMTMPLTAHTAVHLMIWLMAVNKAKMNIITQMHSRAGQYYYNGQPNTQQPNYQYQQQDMNYNPQQMNTEPTKEKIVAGLLAILIGTLGIHKFYLGYTKSGIIMLLVSLLTFGVGAPVMAVISLIEGILYLTKSDAEFYQTYVQNKKEWF